MNESVNAVVFRRLFNAILLIGVAALAFALSLRRMADSDLWGHLACGEYFLQSGRILKTYYFNCTRPDFPYVNHEWLFQAVISVIYRAAGEPGLMALQVLLILLSFFLLYRILRLFSDNTVLIALLLTLGVVASSHRFILRPQHFSYVFMLFFLLSLFRYRQGSRHLVKFLPLAMLAWVNMHAESIWGILIFGIFLFVERLKLGRSAVEDQKTSWNRLALIFCLVLAASLVNPFTYRTVLWPIYVMKEQFGGVEEILPPFGVRFVFFWVLFGLFVLSSLFNIKKIDPTVLTLAVVFSVIAWTANRGIPHFVFAASPLIAANITEIIKNMPERFRAAWIFGVVVRLAAFVFIVYMIVSIITSPYYLKKYDNIPYPESAINFLRAHNIRGNVLNEHRWGNFILWKAHPDLRPFIDGRFFHKKFYDEYYPVMAGMHGWDSVLDKYGVTTAILTYSPSSSRRINDALFAHSMWRLVYWDDISLVYVKISEETRSVVESLGNNLLNPDRDLYTDFSQKPTEYVRRVLELSERNLESAGDSFKPLIVAGNALYALGENEKALDKYLKAEHVMQPQNPGLLFQIALCYRRQGDLIMAEKYLERCFRIAPDVQYVKTMLDEVRFLIENQSR